MNTKRKLVHRQDVADWLKGRNMTQEQLASFLGTTQEAVSGWIKGRVPHKPYLNLIKVMFADCPLAKDR